MRFHRDPSWGLWDVGKIHVQYVNEHWVQFYIEHKVVNGATAHVNICYTLFDRLRGVDFDEKVERKLREFTNKYHKKNLEIMRLRGKEDKLIRSQQAVG